MHTKGTILQLSAALLCIFFLSGCGDKRVAEFSQEEVNPVSCVIVMPTRVPFEYAQESAADKEELRSGAMFLRSVLLQELQKSKVLRVIDTSQLRTQTYDLPNGNYNVLQEIGQREKCETALLSTISDFSERQGTEYAVDEPASAAFELKLIDTQTGRNLWMSSFNETQSSLMSNLLSFKTAMNRGFKWVTAEDLVANGAQEKIRKCPYFY